MFPPAPPSKLAQRALGAMRIARSFLLLEDDHDVDWEVGQDESRLVAHPHRAPLRRGSAQRRAGYVPARPPICLSPIAPAGHGLYKTRQRRAEPVVERCHDGSPVTHRH